MLAWALASFDACLLAIALFGTGFCILRCFSLPRWISLVLAPIISLFVLTLLATVYNGVIPANYYTLVLLPFVIALLVCFLLQKHRTGSFSISLPRKKSLLLYGAFVLIALFLFGVFFVRSEGSANNYAWLVDNSHHLSVAHMLTQKTNWSPLNPWSYTYYPVGQDPLGENLSTLYFYPPLWQWIVALPATAVSQNIAVSCNGALLVVFVLLVPTSMYGLLRGLGNNSGGILLAGAAVTLGFITFPWLLCEWGPLYPNMLSYALVPAGVVACFLLCGFLGKEVSGLKLRLLGGFLLLLSCFVLLLAQPNGVFTLGVILVPFLVWQISRIPLAISGLSKHRVIRTVLRVVCGLLALVAIKYVWSFCIRSSFMADVVTADWPAFIDEENVFSYILLGHLGVGYSIKVWPQYVIASLVLVGFVAALWDKRARWLALSYLLLAWLYGIAASSTDPYKWLYVGFWYNDSFRLSSALALAGVPLAAYGLATLGYGFSGAVRRLLKRVPRARRLAPFSAGAVVIMAFLCGLNYWVSPRFSPAAFSAKYPLVSAFYPDMDIPWCRPFQRTEYLIARSMNPACLTRVAEKRAFMQQVSRITGDEFVMNYPLDGSLFGFPCEGISTFVRSSSSAIEMSPLLADIAKNLDSLAEKPELAAYLQSQGVNYVMRLENKESNLAGYAQIPDYDAWSGFMHINEHTRGFERILSQDGMELYKIHWEEL